LIVLTIFSLSNTVVRAFVRGTCVRDSHDPPSSAGTRRALRLCWLREVLLVPAGRFLITARGIANNLMANFLQVLSEKAKETRNQLARSAQTPLGATTTTKAELQTSRGPAVLTECVQVTATEPISPLPTAQTNLGLASSAKDQAKAKDGAPPTSSSKIQQQKQPLSDTVRLYLLALAAACLIYNHAGQVLYFLRSTGIGLLDLVALACLVAAAPALPKAQMAQTLQAVRLQAISAGVAVKALPQMSVEISAMIDEIRAMRHDLGAMAKKTAWLPGS